MTERAASAPTVVRPTSRVVGALLHLQASDPRTRALLTNCQSVHRGLMAVFPEMPEAAGRPRAAVSLLYSLDPRPLAFGHSATLLAQSSLPGRWDAFPLPARVSATAAPSEIISQLSPNTICRFRLRANPTRKTRSRDQRPVRVALTTRAEQAAWIERHVEAHGATIESLVITREPIVQGWRMRGDTRFLISFTPVLFTGTLRVSDPAGLAAAAISGFGPEKAYGCGLLCVEV